MSGGPPQRQPSPPMPAENATEEEWREYYAVFLQRAAQYPTPAPREFDPAQLSLPAGWRPEDIRRIHRSLLDPWLLDPVARAEYYARTREEVLEYQRRTRETRAELERQGIVMRPDQIGVQMYDWEAAARASRVEQEQHTQNESGAGSSSTAAAAATSTESSRPAGSTNMTMRKISGPLPVRIKAPKKEEIEEVLKKASPRLDQIFGRVDLKDEKVHDAGDEEKNEEADDDSSSDSSGGGVKLPEGA
ncbi:MAG: hypothetical protein Q9159_004462 [Coniocarpon cinnabarinum]